MSIENINLTPETQEQEKCRVCWKNKITGDTGNGEFIDRESAEAWVKEENKKYPDLEHWLETEDEAK